MPCQIIFFRLPLRSIRGMKRACWIWARRMGRLGSLIAFMGSFTSPLTYAQTQPLSPPSPTAPTQTNRVDQPEDEDYAGSPFTRYGEFNESNDEEADTRFFQQGRFFGVSLGLGMQTASGNRGALWQGGFPVVDFKLHYWFDFNFALDLGFFTAQHYFDTTVQSLGHVDVNLLHLGVDLKYYFNTHNLSAPISFASPYILVGAGSFSKTQNSNTAQTQDNDTSIGVSLGGGLEFVIDPRKLYFELEGKCHVVTFKDTFTTNFQPMGLSNLTGSFFTLTGNILLTW